MMTFLKIMLMAVLLVGLAWIGIAIKMFLQNNGRFSKSCGSLDPVSGKPIACSCDLNKSEACDKL